MLMGGGKGGGKRGWEGDVGCGEEGRFRDQGSGGGLGGFRRVWAFFSR